MKMMDWLAQMLGLPDQFCFSSEMGGGGVIQGTASESTLIAMLCARSQTLRAKGLDPKMSGDDADNVDAKYDVMNRLVAYTSTQAHSSVEKAALLSATRIRFLPTDPELGLDPQALRDQIKADKRKGLIPFILIATLGTTNTCAFDNLQNIGPICML